ncbi:MAG: hypothetical protein RBU27_03680 [Bacteroidota bacterium]|jgi:hypothetical protein|nr:hypothetical protein [Bacteroidota bacterium]
MKRVLSFLALSLALLTATASAQEQHETLFSSPVEHGGFGGVVTKMTSIRGEMGLMVGGYGGWLIDHRLMLGMGGYGLASSIRARSEAEQTYAPNGERLYVEFGYGGLMLEYILAPHRLVHVNVQALVGAGGVNYREDWYDDFLDDNPDHRHHGRVEALFVVEPAVNVELNITDWMRLSAGASYRFVNGIDELRGIEDTDLSGASGQLALKFGAF